MPVDRTASSASWKRSSHASPSMIAAPPIIRPARAPRPIGWIGGGVGLVTRSVSAARARTASSSSPWPVERRQTPLCWLSIALELPNSNVVAAHRRKYAFELISTAWGAPMMSKVADFGRRWNVVT